MTVIEKSAILFIIEFLLIVINQYCRRNRHSAAPEFESGAARCMRAECNRTW
ncbi:hypothetical protein OBV_26570 [Oscillibacter valericigenes Sjm18-20]|nr:hypothetical protein OBV_26570 [Oscillibacter valericigenes Sjm18-20]